MNKSGLSDQAFLDRISAEAQTNAYRRFSEQSVTRPHPAVEMLYEYAAGELGEDLAPAVRAHLALCGQCAREALRLTQVTDELEQDALDWANSPKFASSEPSRSSLPKAVDAAVTTAKSVGERALIWISEIWQPQWAGQLLTAADVPEQHRTFTSRHGDIRLTCYWQDDSPDESAMIHIRWHADLAQEERIWLRFVNPASQALRQEIFLGSRAVGEESFTIQDLRFDFLCEQWAISMALESPSS